MNSNWQTKKLGEICSFVRGPFGGSLKKSIFKKDGYAVYEQQHAIYDQFDNIRYFIDEKKFNEMKRFELKTGDLIMSCSGTMGKIAIVPQNIKKGIINQALLKLSTSKEILNIFLKLWMQSENFQDSLKKYSQGAAIQNVASVKILKDIEIPLPAFPEQQRIVKILDETFEKIEKVKKNAEKNLQNSKDIFDSYLQNIFDYPRRDWAQRKLKEVCTKLVAGGDVPKNDFSRTKTKKYQIPIFANGIKDKGLYGYTNINKITEPSVTVSARGTIGYAEIREEKFFPIVRLIVLIPNTQIVDINFLYYIARNFKFSNTGSSIPQLTIPMIEDILISTPSIQEQKTIVKKIDELSAETKKLESIYQQKLADLEELKKSILGKAFNGEL